MNKRLFHSVVKITCNHNEIIHMWHSVTDRNVRLLSSAVTFDLPADADHEGNIHGPTSHSLFLEETDRSLTFNTHSYVEVHAYTA